MATINPGPFLRASTIADSKHGGVGSTKRLNGCMTTRNSRFPERSLTPNQFTSP